MKKEIKLLCTLGPSSFDGGIISKLDNIGVDIFRINLSHTEIGALKGLISRIKRYTNKPICLDTEGAQIRTGYVKNNRVYLEEGAIVRVGNKKIIGDSGNISLTPAFVVRQLKTGDLLSIDFESAILMVTLCGKDYVEARVVSGGCIGSNKAVSLDRKIELPVFSEKDRKAVKIGINSGLNHFALSFANSKSAVKEFRRLVKRNSYIISKIESKEGVGNLGEIIEASDAILIDRGDLSREEPIEKIPFLQKLIVKKANASGVPVYIATNLLESMVKNKKPTRAEASDVINTLMDGADGLVLAAETAIGDYPVNCAAMISKMVEQFLSYRKGCSLKELQNKDSFLLIEPHGGKLINRIAGEKPNKELNQLRSLFVDENVLLNTEQIAMGTFSPIEGFMNKRELEGVLRNYRLPDGTVWPLPIVLQVDKGSIKNFKEGKKIVLRHEATREPYGLLSIEDIYTYDLDKICFETFGTTDLEHPGVALYKNKENYFLGGKIELLKSLPSEYKEYEMTPRQARIIFENRGWSRIVGFHTRNVIHRVHEHIQMLAFERYHCDGLFVHPVVGPKKEGDYKAEIILRCYELMLKKYYSKGKVCLAAFKNYSRYAGPREAVFTALCRKNFGCSHFIVGRDHAGVKGYYGPNDSHKLFNHLGDIGIVPIFFNEMHYCRECRAYVESCKHASDRILKISGTQARETLKSGVCPPAWFMRRDISKIILEEIRSKREVFV